MPRADAEQIDVRFAHHTGGFEERAVAAEHECRLDLFKPALSGEGFPAQSSSRLGIDQERIAALLAPKTQFASKTNRLGFRQIDDQAEFHVRSSLQTRFTAQDTMILADFCPYTSYHRKALAAVKCFMRVHDKFFHVDFRGRRTLAQVQKKLDVALRPFDR